MATPNDTPETFIIPLSRGQFAKVDKCDADLANVKWQARPGRRGCYYAARTKYPEKSYEGLHRVIMSRVLGYSLESRDFVDHIDGNPLNNVRSNLRIVNCKQNALNSRKRTDNTSGFKGVTFRKDRGMWRARVVKDGKRITVGYANTPEEAFEIYKAAALVEYGEYIRWE